MRGSVTHRLAGSTLAHRRILAAVMNRRSAAVSRLAIALIVAAACGTGAAHAQTQVKAQIAPGATPPWEKGILPITPETYYNAIECGKQGGDPTCVFWDTGLCKNTDFELAM